MCLGQYWAKRLGQDRVVPGRAPRSDIIERWEVFHIFNLSDILEVEKCLCILLQLDNNGTHL